MRISKQSAKVFLDGVEVISTDLPATTLTPEKITIDMRGYINEFVFRHSAGTGIPTIPTEEYRLPQPTTISTTRRARNFGAIKSLLHFDYPYAGEPGDGLTDEVNQKAWVRGGYIPN